MIIRIVHNRHPIDEIHDIRREIRRLEARERELRQAVIQSGDLTGDEYEAVLKHSVSERIDISALRRQLGLQVLKPFLRESACDVLRIKSRKP
jgi:hypothetical protein